MSRTSVAFCVAIGAFGEGLFCDWGSAANYLIGGLCALHLHWFWNRKENAISFNAYPSETDPPSNQ